MNAETVLDFWFKELSPAQWWQKSNELDEQIAQRFQQTHALANSNGLASWRETAHGRLAEIIVLDQFSRNIYRDQLGSFASDDMALELAQQAVDLNQDTELNTTEKSFMYMPFMHSESNQAHQRAIELFDQPGLENSLNFEHKHKAIIDRFGRYPHRNEILGRQSSKEELKFLEGPNSSF